MKNINYSIKSNLKYRTKESVCCPCSLERSVGLLKTAVTTGRNLFQLLLVHRRGNHHTISPDGECKKIPTSFSYEGGITLDTETLHYSSPSEKFATTWKNILFHTISIRIIIGLHKSNMEPSEWREIIHQNTYQKFHRKHRRRLPLSFRERYTQYKNKASDAFNQDAPK